MCITIASDINFNVFGKYEELWSTERTIKSNKFTDIWKREGENGEQTPAVTNYLKWSETAMERLRAVLGLCQKSKIPTIFIRCLWPWHSNPFIASNVWPFLSLPKPPKFGIWPRQATRQTIGTKPSLTGALRQRDIYILPRSIDYGFGFECRGIDNLLQ